MKNRNKFVVLAIINVIFFLLLIPLLNFVVPFFISGPSPEKSTDGIIKAIDVTNKRIDFVIGVAFLCWTSILTVTLEIYLLLPNLKDALASLGYMENLSQVKNKKAAISLKNMGDLHKQIAEDKHFKESDPIMKYLVQHHMNGYINALNEAYNLRKLPLSSAARMDAAEEAIKSANIEIVAVSADNDLWLRENTDSLAQIPASTPYLIANIEKARSMRSKFQNKRFRFKRVYIFRNKGHLENLRNMLDEQKNELIEIRYAYKAELEERLKYDSAVTTSIVNILICDNKVLACSTNPSTHEGFLTDNKDIIKEYKNTFNRIWDNSYTY